MGDRYQINKRVELVSNKLDYIDNMCNPETEVISIALKTYGDEVWRHIDKSKLSEKQIWEIIKYYGSYDMIKYFDNLSEEFQLRYINFYNHIGYIKNITEISIKEYIKNYSHNIGNIENPSDELKLYAINNDAFAIKSIENPSYELIRIAIDKKPSVIGCIKNASDELKLYAIRKDPDAIKYLEEQNENLFREAIKIKPSLIRFMYNPTSDLIALASSIDSKCLWYEGYYTDGEEWRTYGGWSDKIIKVEGFLRWNHRLKCWHIYENCYELRFSSEWELRHHINKDYAVKLNVDKVENEENNTKLNPKTSTGSNMDKENIVIKIIKLIGIFFD